MSDVRTVFVTPGHIDIRSFTVMGMHAKPNSDDPIGHFGTGLKNALAILMKHGIKVKLFIGIMEYEFYTRDADFRGTSFKECMMRKRKAWIKKWSSTALPYTTELGKEWEIWMAYRELESNTRDEGGESFVTSDGYVADDYNTYIEVYGQRFIDEYEEAEVFLSMRIPPIYSSNNLKIYDKPSKYIYYKGLRVFETQHPCMYTYNFIQMYWPLTEDRTLRYPNDNFQSIASAYKKMDNKTVLHRVMGASKESFEHSLPFDEDWVKVGDTFTEVLKSRKRRLIKTSPRALTYYSTYIAVQEVADKYTLVKDKDDPHRYEVWEDQGVSGGLRLCLKFETMEDPGDPSAALIEAKHLLRLLNK